MESWPESGAAVLVAAVVVVAVKYSVLYFGCYKKHKDDTE